MHFSPKLKHLSLQVGLSAFVLFHLVAVVLTPNKETYLGYRFSKWMEPYVNFLEISTSWNFFAPEPGPPPIFVEYELQNQAREMLEHGLWPPLKSQYFFRERQNRRVAIARFMVIDPLRAERMMGPFLCSKNPNATSVKIWRMVYTLPPLSDVSQNRRKIGDDVGAERKWITEVSCPEQKKAVIR